MSDNHSICRSLLKDIMKDVRKHVPVEERKKFYSHKSWRGQYEFQGPGGVYWHGQACCSYYAKYNGWCAYLRYIGKDV